MFARQRMATMIRKHLHRLIAPALLLALAACASTGEQIEPYRNVACFAHARVSLADAVANAERAEGQKAIDAQYVCAEELDCLKGNPGQYHITFYENGALRRIAICPARGVVLPLADKSAFRRLLDLDFAFEWPKSEMTNGAPAALAAPVTLHDAIGRAEATGGRAIAAHLKTTGGETGYVVDLVEDGRVYGVAVSAQTGAVQR
jgi:hypothetical protein